MKLIIDIDEDLFNELLQGTTSNRQNDKILKCVKNATPLQAELEEIKAEIKKLTIIPYGTMYGTEKTINRDCTLQILDKRIKEIDNDE